jgi:hypothetical protein
MKSEQAVLPNPCLEEEEEEEEERFHSVLLSQFRNSHWQLYSTLCV